MGSRYSPYIDLDATENRASFDRCRLHLQRVQPTFIMAFNAAVWNESESLLSELMNASPASRVIWRAYPHESVEDAGYYDRAMRAGKSTSQAASEWIEMRVGRWRDFVKRNRIVIKLLNEAAPVLNAPFETEVIRQLGEDGIRCAGMAWATGTPDIPEYGHPAITNCLRMAAKYDAILNCHEYGSFTPAHENDLVNRFTRTTEMYAALKLPSPTVVIGEFGVAGSTLIGGILRVDAEAGWLRLGASEQAYFDYLKRSDAAWYKPRGVYWNLFRWGERGRFADFNISRAATLLELLESEARKDFAMTAIEWNTGKTVPNSGVNLRKIPNGTLITTIPKDTKVFWRPSEDQAWYRVFWEKSPTETYEGYSSAALIIPVPVEPPPPPPPPPDPIPDPPPPPEDWWVRLTPTEIGELYASLAQASVLNRAVFDLLNTGSELQSHINAVLLSATNELYAAYVLLKKAQADTSAIEERLKLLDALKQEWKVGGAGTIQRIVDVARKPVIEG